MIGYFKHLVCFDQEYLPGYGDLSYRQLQVQANKEEQKNPVHIQVGSFRHFQILGVHFTVVVLSIDRICKSMTHSTSQTMTGNPTLILSCVPV